MTIDRKTVLGGLAAVGVLFSVAGAALLGSRPAPPPEVAASEGSESALESPLPVDLATPVLTTGVARPRRPLPEPALVPEARVREARVREARVRAARALEARSSEPSRAEDLVLSRGPVRLRRLVVAPGVEGREPLAPSDRLAPGPRVYAFLDAVNSTDAPVELRVTFEPVGGDGESTGHVRLAVPAEVRRWRTWGFTRNLRPGRWEAVVRLEDRVIGRRAFEVE